MPIPCIVYVTAAVWSAQLSALWARNLQNSRCTLRFYNDSAVLESAAALNVLHAVQMVRPWAYKVDLWRYAKLLSTGGIFYDAETRLYVPPEVMFDLSQSLLQLPYDRNARCYYNAIMAAPANNGAVNATLRRALHNVALRSYGRRDAAATLSAEPWLAVTGPCTLGAAVALRADVVAIGRHVGPHTLDTRRKRIAVTVDAVKSTFSSQHYGAHYGARTLYTV